MATHAGSGLELAVGRAWPQPEALTTAPTRRGYRPAGVTTASGEARMLAEATCVLIFCLVRLEESGLVAQWESVRLTRGRSLVRNQPGPPGLTCLLLRVVDRCDFLVSGLCPVCSDRLSR